MRQQFIKTLYEILKNHETKHGYHNLKDAIPRMFTSGVYFFFDKITPIENNQYKITYIGISKPNENNRLAKHKNGASCFRDSVKNAISKKFSLKGTPTVNDYIHNLPYLFIFINDKEVIENIEQRTIELISNYNQAQQIHKPNVEWLGNFSDKEKVRSSHIWNSHYVANYNVDNNYREAMKLLEVYSNKMAI